MDTAPETDDLLLIVTPTTVEWEAMRAKITRGKAVPRNPHLIRGTIGGAEVLCAAPGKGPGFTSAITMQLIAEYRIRYVLLVGVAGGLGGVARGDVVIPTAVVDLDYGKVEGGEFRRRKEYDWRPDYQLLRAAELLGESAKGTWKKGIIAKRPDRKDAAASKVHFGYVGSSSKVVDDTTYPVIRDALKTAPELLAVEMEATGAAATVHVAQSTTQIGILMIRGISDLVDDSKSGSGSGTRQRGKWKPYAADVAATFTAALIKSLYPRVKSKRGTSKVASAASDSTVSDNEEKTDNRERALAAAIESFLAGLGEVGTLSLRPDRKRHFEVPPSVAKVVRRSETIDVLRKQVESRTWTSIVGPRGSGKTHAAILLTLPSGKVRWLNATDLRDAALFEARLLDAAGATATGNPFEAICQAVGRGGLIVLDDVPPPDATMSASLSSLAQAARKWGVHVLTLSAATLSAAIRRALPDGDFASQTVPDFSVAEAEELFRLYGAPDAIRVRMTFLNASARGNPTLLTAIAEFLRARDWRWSADEVNAILNRAHLSDIEPEILQRLLHDVNDATTRELFHRLRLSRRPLQQETILRLAAIEPSVDRVRERLLELEGLWVRRTERDVFEVAPLAEALPLRTLDVRTEGEAHGVLADEIVRRRALSPEDVALAVTHFVAADEVNRAGGILAYALSSIVADKAWHETLLPSIWGTVELPRDMDLSLRLFIRLQQLKIARATKKDLQFIADDLKRLVGRSTAVHAALLATVAFEAALKRRVDPHLRDVALTALQRLAPLIPENQLLTVSGARLPEGTWITAFHLVGCAIESDDELERWMRAVESLSPQVASTLASTPELERKTMVNAWWLRAVERKAEDRELDALIARLRRLEEWAAGRGDELLAACAARAQIVVTGEYLRSRDSAVAIGERAVALYQSNSAQFLVAEAVGTQYSVTSDWEPAETWFSAALEHAAAASVSERVVARMRRAQVRARRDPARAVDDLQDALAEVRTIEEPSPHELPQVLGDLGTALWQSGQKSQAVDAWSEAADLLFQADLTDKTLQGLFVVLHVALAYPALDVRIGRPPVLPESGESMEQPRVGIFLRDFASEAGGFKEEFRTQVALSLTYLAASVDDRDRARIWATRAHQQAEAQQDVDRLGMIALELLPLALLDDDVTRALDLIEERILHMHEDVRATMPGGSGDDGVLLQFLLLPLFRAARLLLDDAAAGGKMLAAIGRKAGANIKSSAARDALLSAIDATLAGSTPSALAAIYDRDDLPETVRLAARVLHSLDHRVPVGERAKDHLLIGFGVRARSPIWGSGYRWIVLDFFETYWMRELLTNAFRFNRPADVRNELARVRNITDADRLQTLLLAIADALGVTLAGEFRRSLEAQTPPS